MHSPSITAAYLAVLVLLYAMLGFRVSRLRWKYKVGFGDGHPVGMYARPGMLQFRIGRVGGTVLTNFVLINCALAILWRLLTN